ncbi:MAG: Ig-like domain-containing protein [Limisphaerales bacterium]
MNLPARRWLNIISALFLLAQYSVKGADARRLADLNPGSVGSYPSNFTVFSNQVYFSAYTYQKGTELWKYNSSNVVLVADINKTSDDIGSKSPEGNGSSPTWLTSFNGHLYFSAFEPDAGGELWRYDGIETVRLTDINPGTFISGTNVIGKSSWPTQLTVFEGALYFSATSSTNPDDYELWRYDTNGATQVANLHPDAGTNYSSFPTGLKTFNGGLYFMADDGTNGWELWRHSSNGTTLIDINPGDATSSSYPKYFTTYSNHLYFQAYHPDTGFELWKTDGTNASLVADFVPGPDSSYPELFKVMSGNLYFRGTDPAAGYELLKYDSSQITVAADIAASGSSYPKNLTAFGNSLIFTASDEITGWELWKFNGTNATLLSDINPSGDSFPENFIVTAGILYFTATTPESGYELWMYDGNAVSLAADARPGSRDSFPRFLTPLNGKVFFSAADDGRNNWEPWLFDPQFTNRPPTIMLTSPTNASVFSETNEIIFIANAADEFAAIQVEFFSADVLLGIATSEPHTLTTNLPPGTYSIWAQAIDSSGAIANSSTREITVNAAPIQNPEISTVSREGDLTTITVHATNDQAHALEASPDFINWTQVDLQYPLEGIVTLSHQCLESHHYYRVVIP